MAKYEGGRPGRTSRRVAAKTRGRTGSSALLALLAFSHSSRAGLVGRRNGINSSDSTKTPTDAKTSWHTTVGFLARWVGETDGAQGPGKGMIGALTGDEPVSPWEVDLGEKR